METTMKLIDVLIVVSSRDGAVVRFVSITQEEFDSIKLAHNEEGLFWSSERCFNLSLIEKHINRILYAFLPKEFWVTYSDTVYDAVEEKWKSKFEGCDVPNEIPSCKFIHVRQEM